MGRSFLGERIIGEPAELKPYLPFPAAVEAGILENPEALAATLSQPPGEEIVNGRIPNAKGAGILKAAGKLFAYDLVGVEATGSELRVFPASKEAVSHDGKIKQEGVILQERIDERIDTLFKIVALAIDEQKDPWLTHRLGKDRRSVHPGGVDVFYTDPFDTQEYEVQDIDNDTNLMVAKVRQKYFPVPDLAK